MKENKFLNLLYFLTFEVKLYLCTTMLLGKTSQFFIWTNNTN